MAAVGAARLRRLPLILAVVVTTLALALPGSLAAGEVGIHLPGPVPDAVREAVDLETATITDLQDLMEAGTLTSSDLTRLYLERIAAFDEDGPSLNSVLALNPDALDIARALDRERRRSGPRGPLHGIPVLLKDNIDTADMPTTAGSVALAGSTPPDDAFLTAGLREAGAIILGKTTLTEFANFMTDGMPNGYSSWGGQGLNPYDLRDDPSGSSSGSAIAAAAGMAAAAVGTETSGSILSPSRANSVTGLKPTLGLISRDGIVPIGESQDTAGPMGRSVADIAALLGAMTGVDPADPRTVEQAGHAHSDYTQFLDPDALEGARIGVATNTLGGTTSEQRPLIDAAIDQLEALGAEIVETTVSTSSGPDLFGVLTYEFKRDLNAYLGARSGAPVRSLAELIAFNEAHADEALKFGQTQLEASQAVDLEAEEDEYLADLAAGKAVTQGNLDAAFDDDDLDAIVFGQNSPAGVTARAGYPSLIVPVGYDEHGRDPVSITFVGRPWSEPELIGFAYAYEQAAQAWRPPSEINPSAWRCPAPTAPGERARPLLGACPS